MAKRLDIVDMSHHNVVKDFAAIKNAGVLGMIHKATEGATYVDPKYSARKIGCAEVGLPFASYHFFRPGDPVEQMLHFTKTVAPVRHRLVLDYEDERCMLANLCTAISWLRKNFPDCPVTVYGGHVIKDQMNNKQWYDHSVLQQTDFWIAHYTVNAAPVWPNSVWPAWALWQYSDGRVGDTPHLNAGVVGDVDCNMFNGERSEIERWFNPAGSDPAPEPAPTKSAVSINIDVEGADTVHVTVNGKKVT